MTLNIQDQSLSCLQPCSDHILPRKRASKQSYAKTRNLNNATHALCESEFMYYDLRLSLVRLYAMNELNQKCNKVENVFY